MKLEKLSEENLVEINKKKIVCYGCSQSYLKELEYKYPDIMGNIIAVYNENNCSHKMNIVEDRSFPVLPQEQLKQEKLPQERLLEEQLSQEQLGKEVFQNANWLILSDYFDEAYNKLLSIEAIRETVDVIYYFENYETEAEMEYRRKYKHHGLENIILFRSGPHASAYIKGMDFSDNARALFEYMLANKFNETYELIWLVKNPTEFSQYHQYKNVRFIAYDWSISKNREERNIYYKALCLAKFIFFTDAYGFARNCRKDQIRVQLWHGCGFKTRVNFVRCEKRYEYTTVISDVYSEIHQDIYGLREDQVLVTGYAKQDWLFHPYADWQEKLNIPKAKKYIFWLPTFRSAKEQLQNLNQYELAGQTGLPIVSTYEMLEQLNALLKKYNSLLIIKLHPFQDREQINSTNRENIVMLDNRQLAKEDIQINQLLGYANALISDYSSAAVDYMLLDRPIAFTLDDVDKYQQSRGFVFEKITDWLPGAELLSFEDMCHFIKEVSENLDTTREKRRVLTKKMHKYQDDKNSMRIVEMLHI